MPSDIKIVPADDIPPDARVYHFDELDDRSKERLPALVSTDRCCVTVDDETAAGMADYGLIKFTDYYRVVSS